MSTLLFIEQSPNPLAVKFVFKDVILENGALIFDKSSLLSDSWLEPFWNLEYLQQIYIAQNFVVFIHKSLDKKSDSHISPWFEKTQEIQNLIHNIPFPLTIQNEVERQENNELKFIQAWLDKFIRKATWIHGGAFQAVRLEKGILYLRPEGACYDCPYLGMTVYKGILEPLRLEFSEIQNIQISYDFA